MPPLEPFGGAGTQQDADILRQKIGELFGSAPPGSVLADPARRQKLFTAAVHVAELTVQLAAVQRFLPGTVGRIFGPLISGVEKDPGTGRVAPTQNTAGNFLPSPIGFLDPTAVGLPRNFYLPSAPDQRAGAVELLPRAADRIGLGIPEQRAADEARKAELRDIYRANLAAQLASASDVTLSEIASGQGGFNAAGEVRAFAHLPESEIQSIARAEQVRRGIFPGVPLAVSAVTAASEAFRGQAAENLEFIQDVSAELTREQGAILADLRTRGVTLTGPTDPFGAPVAMGSTQPALQQPTSDAAIRNARQATGINRELVAERADP